jgi:hypothetical protein
VITKHPQLEAVLASRVALMGHSIERKATRHYLGRLYATAASLALGVVVYDTQCGAKLFRVNDTLRAAIADPFPERWSFDVELLARLLHPAPGVAPIDADRIVEVPLNAWRDVGGSKLHMLPAARVADRAGRCARRVRRHATRSDARGERRRGRSRSVSPHFVTSSIDSAMIRPDIFDLPRVRSRNTIGVSTIR